MSPSSRHLSPVSAAANRRQLANIALATVLAFVIAGMVVVLAQHSDRTLAIGDVGVAVSSAPPEVTSPVAGSATASTTSSSRPSSAARSSAARSTAAGSSRSSRQAVTTSASSAIAGVATTRARTTAAASSHHASPSRTLAGSSTAHSSHPPVHASASPTAPARAPASSTHPVPPSSSPTRTTTHPAPPASPTHSASPTPPKPAAAVQIAQGARVPFNRCFARHCYYVAITLQNFSAGTHTVTCSNSRDGSFATFTTTNTSESQRCFVWHSNVQVWVTVDSVRSNTLAWNPDHRHR